MAVGPDVALRAKQQARVLRRRETPSEKELWNALRARHFRGLKFRRQQAVGPFVLDFYCAEERIAVEIDGSVHDDAQQIVNDKSRQRAIEAAGIRFVRLRDGLVINDTPAALRIIEAALQHT